MTKPLNVASEDVIELAFAVPDLRRRPVIGGGCCAIPAQFLIEEALKEVEQVREVAVSDDTGLVLVWVTEDGGALEEELKGRIEGLGYSVEKSNPEDAEPRGLGVSRILVWCFRYFVVRNPERRSRTLA